MSDFRVKLKDFLGRSAKFIGRTANTTAKATKYKYNEISAMTKRRELVNDLGKKVLELYNSDMNLPFEAADLIEQIRQLDAELSTLRAEHAAEKAAAAQQHAMRKAALAAERTAAQAADMIDQCTAPVKVDVAETVQPVVTSTEDAAVPTLELDIEKAAEPESEVPTLNV